MKNIIRSISLGLAVVLFGSAFSLGAFAKPARGKKGNGKRQYYYADLGENTVELTGINLSKSDFNAERLVIKIPSEEDGKKVVKIGKGAFKSIKIPYTAVLPDSISEIGSRAFAGTRLLDIRLSSSLKSIGKSAFRGTDLTQIALNRKLKRIEAKAFFNTEISRISLPDKVKKVGNYAFSTKKTSVNSVYIPKNIKKIGYNAFSSVSDKTKITGYTGTLSEAYAQKYNFKFTDAQTQRSKDRVNYKSLVAKSCRTEIISLSSPYEGTVKLAWNRTTTVENMTGVAEYQILIADNPSFKNPRRRNLKHGYSAKIKGLKRSTVYYVKIRGVAQIRMKWFWGDKYSYAKDFNGAWSNVKTVKTL